MAASTRSAKFKKIHRVLKKHYEVAGPDTDRPVLEYLLFGALLENAPMETADQAYSVLEHTFFDWNEVRVTTVRELAEVLACHPEPAAVARRVRQTLQAVFEKYYCFDLEEFRKVKLGDAESKLAALDGTTRFMAAYTIQTVLGGHSIPLDDATFDVLDALGALEEGEREDGRVAGLERAIAKNKGLEFATLLHEFAQEFRANPRAKGVLEIVKEIDSGAQKALLAADAQRAQEAAAEAAAEISRGRQRKKVASKETESAKANSKKPAKKKAKATEPAQPQAEKKAAKKSSGPKKAPAQKKKAAKKKKASSPKKTTKKSATSKSAEATRQAKGAKARSGKSPSSRLSRKKPR